MAEHYEQATAAPNEVRPRTREDLQIFEFRYWNQGQESSGSITGRLIGYGVRHNEDGTDTITIECIG